MQIKEPSEQTLTFVEVSKIRRPQIIDRIDIEELEIRELAANIDEQDLLQAPVLRPMGDEFEIVAGDRRILAIKLLEWEKVQCVVKEMTDKQAAEIRASENLQRVNLSVIEEARIYQNLHVNHGLSIDQIARRMGKSGGTVKRRLDLLKMPESLQLAMHKKHITYGVAEALWVISDTTALDYYLGFAVDHGVTVTIARQWANDWKSSQRRAEEEQMDPGEALTSPMTRPVYIACDICQEPELVQDLQVVRMCKECARKIALARSSG